MTDKVCTYCGKAGHRAHECPTRGTGRPHCFEFAMDFLGGDDAVAVRAYVEALESDVRRLSAAAEERVPADVASSMRWRIRELEAQVAELRAQTPPPLHRGGVVSMTPGEVPVIISRGYELSAFRPRAVIIDDPEGADLLTSGGPPL